MRRKTVEITATFSLEGFRFIFPRPIIKLLKKMISRDLKETWSALARRGSDFYRRPHVVVLELELLAQKNNITATLKLRDRSTVDAPGHRR